MFVKVSNINNSTRPNSTCQFPKNVQYFLENLQKKK